MKIECTTSTRFKNPALIGNYHHKKLNPEDILGWKNGSKIMVRSLTDGIDYFLEFQSDGQKITPDYPDYDIVKNWEYYAQFKIMDKSKADMQKKRYISKKLKRAVLNRQNHKCNLCGEILTEEKSYHFDHKLEMSCGGLTTLDNLQVLCNNVCHKLKTFSLKKAKEDGLINPYDWNESHQDFLVSFIKKIINGPLANEIFKQIR